MRNIARLHWLALVLCALGCRSDVSSGVGEKACGAREWSEYLSAPPSLWDVLVVVDATTAELTTERRRELVRALADGDTDADGVPDRYAPHALRIRTIEPAELVGMLGDPPCPDEAEHDDSCDGAPLEPAYYRWAPYGFADDIDAFVDRATRLAPDGDTDPPTGYLAPFMSSGGHLLVITRTDICGEASQDPCDPQLTAVVEHAIRENWLLDVIAGVQPSEEVRPQDTSSTGCTTDAWAAGPAPRLVAAAEDTQGRVGSICSPDFRPLLEEVKCVGASDYAALGCTYGRDVLRRDDGTAACRLTETLPRHGPITHCAQLRDVGRRTEPVRMEEGREVCLIEQQPASTATDPTVHGWYWKAEPGDLTPPVWRTDIPPDCAGVLHCDAPQARMLDSTPSVPGSTLRLTCRSPLPEGSRPECPE